MESTKPGNAQIHTKVYVIFIGVVSFLLICLLLLLLFPLFFQHNKPRPTPTIAPTPTPVFGQYIKSRTELTPLQKTAIGKTSAQDIAQTYTIVSKETLPDGSVKYNIPSIQPGVTDEIITTNGKVTSELTITQTSIFGPLPRIDDYEKLFGKPEMVTSGTKSFGKFADAHIYASKGVMFVVNRFTHEVYQIQRFEPLSLAQYKQKYAEYILPSTEDQAP